MLRVIFLFFILNQVSAEKLQILHTNDFHSYLDHIEHNNEIGGSARLKAIIDREKSKALEDGIPSIVVDAGDFSEGNIYYMANKGRNVFQIHNEMGYDVVTLGNHDYLMGTDELDQILGEMNLKFQFLAANVRVHSRFQNIREKLKKRHQIQIGKYKIGFVGVTSNELFYTWRMYNGKIKNPISVAVKEASKLRREGSDLVVALTHIGLKSDKKLAEQNSQIDLIIGGHSHDLLDKVVWKNSRNGKKIPIVQAGSHGAFLGKILLDIQGPGRFQVLDYQLIPVKIESEFKDLDIQNLVDESNNNLYELYGKEWNEEIIAKSELQIGDKAGIFKWGKFASFAIKEAAETDVAIHAPDMNGENFPVGKLTRRDLFNSYPRVFELQDRLGWSIYRTNMRGFLLKRLFELTMLFDLPLAFSGVSFQVYKGLGKYKVKNILINGKKINPLSYYSVALPEGIVRGGQGISPFSNFILKNSVKTPILILDALEEKLKKEGGIFKEQFDLLGEVQENNFLFFDPSQK